MMIILSPQPGGAAAPPGLDTRIAAVVLAAGRSTRMGGPNKLLARVGDRPILRRVVENALRSRAAEVLVVTGHHAPEIRRVLEDLPVRLVHNPNFAEGLSSSIRTGIAAVAEWADAAIICLGDMPNVGVEAIDAIIAAFNPGKGALIAVPTAGGQRGNPVLWARRFFCDLQGLSGDLGGRRIVHAYEEVVIEVPLSGTGVLDDVDTRKDLAAARRRRR